MNKQRLNALVATHIMGWKPWHDSAWNTGEQLPDFEGPRIVSRKWSPTSDPIASRLVVEKMVADRWECETFTRRGDTTVTFMWSMPTDDDRWGQCCDASPDTAIVLAALEAKGVDVEEG